MDHGTGSVIVNYGSRALVEIAPARNLLCSVRGKRLRTVCGDRVEWRRVDTDSGVIERILPRRNALERADGRHRTSVLAANLDRVIVVTAPEPPLDPVLIDRYLVMIERAGIEAGLLLNKSDVMSPAHESVLAEFADLGYPVWLVSALTGAGLDALRAALVGRTTMLVGQSGVGKSSLLNALVPDLGLQTRALSLASGEGRHTTTTSSRYRLASGDSLVDSPGVREYWLPEMPAAELMRGFREIARAGETCRFRDCMHVNEPDCAVRAAVDDRKISARRYASYRALLRAVSGRSD